LWLGGDSVDDDIDFFPVATNSIYVSFTATAGKEYQVGLARFGFGLQDVTEWITVRYIKQWSCV
jgi:hypothetical protein